MRDVEQRIERAGQNQQLQGWRPTLGKPNRERPANGLPQDIDEHIRLMCDILVLAFQTDTTRFCTLKERDHELGTLEAGKLADLIVVEGDHPKHFEALRRVSMIMQRGVVFQPESLLPSLPSNQPPVGEENLR